MGFTQQASLFNQVFPRDQSSAQLYFSSTLTTSQTLSNQNPDSLQTTPSFTAKSISNKIAYYCNKTFSNWKGGNNTGRCPFTLTNASLYDSPTKDIQSFININYIITPSPHKQMPNTWESLFQQTSDGTHI